jgi:hypothetical protein
MSKNIAMLGIFLLLATGFGVATTNAEPQPPNAKQEIVTEKKPDEAQVTFEALKQQLPNTVTNWCASILLKEPEIRVARRTSSEEAKITFVAKGAFLNNNECIFSLHLRFYEGMWTVIRWEGGGSDVKQGELPNVMPKLILAIDESKGK